jgi:hypothetical protein
VNQGSGVGRGLKEGKRCKRRGLDMDQGSGGGRGLKEEAGRWIKGLDGEED